MSQQPIDSPFGDIQRRLQAWHLSEWASNRNLRRWCLSLFFQETPGCDTTHPSLSPFCHLPCVSSVFTQKHSSRERNCLSYCGTAPQLWLSSHGQDGSWGILFSLRHPGFLCNAGLLKPLPQTHLIPFLSSAAAQSDRGNSLTGDVLLASCSHSACLWRRLKKNYEKKKSLRKKKAPTFPSIYLQAMGVQCHWCSSQKQ